MQGRPHARFRTTMGKEGIRTLLLALLLCFTCGLACVSGRSDLGQDSSSECEASTAGQPRWNDVLDRAEVCDGTAWRSLVGEPDTPVLLLAPNDVLPLTVAGSGNPARGGWATVQVRNLGSVASSPLIFEISDPSHFELDSATCGGMSLAPGARCDVSIRAKASATSTFRAVMVVNADNRPSLRLEGTATLACPVGEAQAGGIVAECSEGGYYLIASPSGCDGNPADPDCTPILDRTTVAWGVLYVSVGSTHSTDGPSNSAAMLSLSPSDYPAAQYCDALSAGGHNDWYLPAVDELAAMMVALGRDAGLREGNEYWTSTEGNINNAETALPVTGELGSGYKSETLFVRCARRDFVTPPVQHDPCTVGDRGAGGTYIACGASYDLVLQPSGCDGGTNEPSCAGGVETITRAWAPNDGSTTPWTGEAADGAQNTVNLQTLADQQGIGTYPAAEYCMAMVYLGYNDWYLPAPEELRIVSQVHNSGMSLDVTAAAHWSSLSGKDAIAVGLIFPGVDLAEAPKTVQHHVRCMRREGQQLPGSQVPDTGCQPGGLGAGGVFLSCGVEAQLVTTPGGCLSTVGPCDGGNDSISLSWGSTGTSRGTTSTSNGALNTQQLDLVNGVGNHPAAEFCAAMQWGGYDDWYLPASSDAEVLALARVSIGGLTKAGYWTSTEHDAQAACYVGSADGALRCRGDTFSAAGKGSSNGVRCVRTNRTLGPADGCTVGEPGPGGLFFVCDDEYNLVSMPSGCDGSTSNPTCIGADGVSVGFAFLGATTDGATDEFDGQANTAALDAVLGVGVRPAAEYCAHMIYGGYDDWYLPAQWELVSLSGVFAVLGGFSGSPYWSSTVRSDDPASAVYVEDSWWALGVRSNSSPVRCVRRD